MKTIITIILLFIGMMGWGQKAKLDKWGEFNEYFYLYGAVYTYDSFNRLMNVAYHASFPGHYPTALYSNDTLIRYGGVTSGSISHYYYLDDDTVMRTHQGEEGIDTNYLWISENNEVINGQPSLKWEDGNCFSAIYDLSGDTLWYRDYYSDYINPWYEENKYLRMGSKVGIYSGNYNLWSNHYEGNYHDELDVVESIGPFPTVIDCYRNGNYYSTYYFEYKEIDTYVQEIPADNYKVLSVDYFDLQGREITKPQKGFYIERQITDKGIISKKYFIQ